MKINGFTYLASMFRNLVLVLLSAVFFKSYGQHKNPFLQKLSPSLQQVSFAKKAGDSVLISVSTEQGIELPFLKKQAASASLFFYTGKVAAADLLLLAQQPKLLFISELKTPTEEINTGASDPTLNTIFFAQHRFPQTKGEGIAVSIKERLFDTTDIDLKGRVFFTGREHSSVTAHASLMTTIIAGAGNSSPFAVGAAPAARVSSASFTQLFPEPDSFYQRHSITVQNHSYGTAVENFYGNEAVAYDASATANPGLLAVFSAGNAGTSTPTDGVYEGLAEAANLTGNFKQAKNTITVSGVDSLNGLLMLSSKGPAYDGRVKPELVAYGEDGSSGAAALVAGAAVLVQDHYRQFRGQIPPSSLTKAVLLNSANDVGPEGIDFRAGYGSLDAYKAVRTIQEGRYALDSIQQGKTKTFPLIIPANTARLKLTLVWNDPPAPPNAPKALVNDLDLTLQSSSGDEWLPWVLDPSPHADVLQMPAQRKQDTLNNVEQISLDNPAAGNYTIIITGKALQSPSQAFALAYEMEGAHSFYWTFPTATDWLVAGNRHTLRWQTNLSGVGKVEYATDGNNWREVGIVDTLQKNYLRWVVPDTASTVQLRMINGTTLLLSDTFTISRQPLVQTGFNCADSFLLYWSKQGVNEYRLYQLGEKYMTSVSVTMDTALILAKTKFPSFYYSVAPIVGGKEGIRSNSADYAAQGAGCYLRSFYLQNQTATTANFVAELGTLYNVTEVMLEGWKDNVFVALQTLSRPATTSFNFNSIPLHPGENRFRFRMRLTNGQLFYSNVETVYSVGETAPVFVYPNPVAQGGELKALTREVGRYTISVFDVGGRKLYENPLNSSVSSLPSRRFGKGLYFILIRDKEGKTLTLKQVIF